MLCILVLFQIFLRPDRFEIFRCFFNSYYSCFSYSYSDHFIIIILFQMILILIQTIHHQIDNHNMFD